MKRELLLKNDYKNVIWNMVGTSMNAFNSLFFSIIATRINGLEKAGYFAFGFATACIFYVLGTYIIRIFQVTDINNQFSDSDYLIHRIATTLLMITVGTFFVLLRKDTVEKRQIIFLLFLFKSLEAFSEFFYAIFQKHMKLYRAGISMTLKSSTGLILFIIVDLYTSSLALACTAIVVADVLVIIFYDIPNIQKLKLLQTPKRLLKILVLFRVGFPAFMITLLNIYLVNAPRYAIDQYFISDDQAIYTIILLPATFMSLLSQYILQPFVVRLSNGIKAGDKIMIQKIIFYIIGMMVLLGIIVLIIAYYLEVPILEWLYHIKLHSYHFEMMIIIVGSVFLSLESIISNILIALRKMLLQSIILLIVSTMIYFASPPLVLSFGIRGASLQFLFTMGTLTVAFGVILAITMRRYPSDCTGTLRDKCTLDNPVH